jgi:type I restriction enzyme, S subunit
VINKNWPVRPLGDLFDIGAGKTMSAAARQGVHKTAFLRTSNVLWDEIDLTVVDEMAISASELREKTLRPGDLLVCEGGEIGRAAVWNGEVEIMSFQNHLHRLRPMADDVEPRFYVYFLQSAFTQLGIFEGAGNKTTIPNLSRSRLAALDVPHPDIEEQRAIAKVLACVREAIRVCDASAAVAEDLKRAVMRALFTQGLRDDAQMETEIGPLPQLWSAGRLDQYAGVISTRMAYTELESLSTTDGEGAVRVLGIKVSDMNSPGNETRLVTANLERLLPLTIVQKRCAPPRTIIFPKRGAAIATNKKRISATWTVFDPNVIGVIAKNGLDQDFLFYWFQGFDLRSITEPGPTPQLNKKNLDPIIIPIPPTLEEQREIVAILDALDRKIDVHRRKRAALDNLFKSLLHKLMTGEVRVTDLNLSALPPESQKETAA